MGDRKWSPEKLHSVEWPGCSWQAFLASPLCYLLMPMGMRVKAKIKQFRVMISIHLRDINVVQTPQRMAKGNQLQKTGIRNRRRVVKQRRTIEEMAKQRRKQRRSVGRTKRECREKIRKIKMLRKAKRSERTRKLKRKVKLEEKSRRRKE